MTRLLERTYNLNVSPRLGPDGTQLVQIETMAPMTAEQFLAWLHAADHSPEQAPRPASRASIEVWRDTKDSPRPKAELEKMNEFAKQWKRFKRKFPHLSKEELDRKTQEWLDMKASFLESFAEMSANELLSGFDVKR